MASRSQGTSCGKLDFACSLAKLEERLERLAAVPGRVDALEQQLAALLPSEGAGNSNGHDGAEMPLARPRFKPVAPASCLHVRPCLLTSAAERIQAGCAASIWRGRWAVDPLTALPGALRSAAGWARQHFWPAAAECEAADPYLLSPARKDHATQHVTVASSQFTTSRLRGLRDALWLMVGTSIDHGIVYEVCVRFGREGVRVADAAPTQVHPRPVRRARLQHSALAHWRRPCRSQRC